MDADDTRKIVAFPGQFARSRTYALRSPMLRSTVRFSRPVQTRLPFRSAEPDEPTLDERINDAKATIANYQDLLAKGPRPVTRILLEGRVQRREAELESLIRQRREQREQTELPLPAERSAI